jgi:hypothetical protein
MSGRRCTFIASGLRCNAEHLDDEWRVTVAEVTVARAPDLARAIEEATGGLIAGEAASRAASSIRERIEVAGAEDGLR